MFLTLAIEVNNSVGGVPLPAEKKSVTNFVGNRSILINHPITLGFGISRQSRPIIWRTPSTGISLI